MSSTNPWPPLNDYGPAEKKQARFKMNVTAVIAWIKKRIKRKK